MADRVYSEAEIPEGYNQPKDEDDGTYQTPFRYLTQWYLTDTKNPDKRLALPDSVQFRSTHVIRGILESSTDGDMPPIHVELRKLKWWSVDRSKSKRGIWALSSSGPWYWLKQPHSTQESLHLPIRAKMGLLSNVVDVFMEERESQAFYYAHAHIKKSPQSVYDQLSCQDDKLHARFNDPCVPLYKTPWDIALLKNSVPFLKQHLKEVCTGYDESIFWEELKKLKAPKVKWTPEMYKESAELAEQRGQQMPWGEPCVNPKPLQPNWMMEAMINVTFKEHCGLPLLSMEKSADRPADSSDDEYVPKTKTATRKQETRKRTLEDSSDDDYIPKKRPEKTKKPLSRKRTIHDSSDDDCVPKRKVVPKKKNRRSLSQRDLEDSDQDVMPPARKKVRHSIMDDSGANGEKENKAQTPLEETKYSAKRMVEALKRFNDFLRPTPSPDESGEWDDVELKFEMSEEMTASALEEMRSSEEWSDECKLLMIAVFRKSCTQKNKLVKKLFNLIQVKKLFNLEKGTGAELTGIGIFEQWRHDAKATLEQLPPKPPLSTANWYSETCAYKLLIAHISFIKNCFVVNNKKVLDQLKTQYFLDWNQPDYLNDVLSFGYKYDEDAIKKACAFTRKYLTDIMKAGDKKKPIVATTTVASVEGIIATGDAASRQENATRALLTDMIEAGDKKKPTLGTTTVASVEGIIATGDLTSQQENENEKAERKRKSVQDRKKKLLAKAANVAALQPGPRAATQPSTSALVTSSGPSELASAPADPGRPARDNEFSITPEWTDAKPLFLLSLEDYKVKIASWPKKCDLGPLPGARPDPISQSQGMHEQQTNTVRSVAGQEHGQEEISSWGDPVVPVPAASRAQETEVTGIGTTRQHDVQDQISVWGDPAAPLSGDLREQEIEIKWGSASRQQDDQEERELTSGVREESVGRQLLRNDQFPSRDHRSRSDDRGSENRDRRSRSNDRRSGSTERRHRNNDRRSVHSDKRSRDNDRGSEHSVSRSRDFDKRSEHSESRSRGYDRGSEPSDIQSRHSDRMSKDDRPRNYSQVDDRLDRRPAFLGMHNGCGRGRGKEMTKPAWMTRSEQQEGASMNARQGSAEGIMHAYRVREEMPARGRGRAMTTPAWMTRRGEQPEGARQVAGKEPAEETSSRGRGRGRTLPAWITRSQGPGPYTSYSNDMRMNGPTGFNEGNAHKG